MDHKTFYGEGELSRDDNYFPLINHLKSMTTGESSPLAEKWIF